MSDIVERLAQFGETPHEGDPMVDILLDLTAEAKTEIESLRLQNDRLLRNITDRQFMMEAYRNMLGDKGLEVASMWNKSRVKRVHFDWTGEAATLTGEQLAQHILDLENAPSRIVENIDKDLSTTPFDFDICGGGLS